MDGELRTEAILTAMTDGKRTTGTDSAVFIEADAVREEPVGNGVTRRILGHDPGLMMTRVAFRAGAIGPVHCHPHRQVTYVERGRFEVQIGDARHILKAGDCFFVPPNVDHGTIALEDGALVDVFAPARLDFLKPSE